MCSASSAGRKATARAKIALDEALVLSAEQEYEVGTAHALSFTALVNWMNGDVAEMAANTTDALALYAQQEDLVGTSLSLVMLAVLARGQHDFETAERLLREALDQAQIQDYLWGVATAEYYLGETKRAKAALERAEGDMACASHDEEAAAGLLLSGFAHYRRQGESLGMAGCLSGLAGITAARGSHRRAAHLLAAAGRLSEASGAFLPPTEKDNYEALAEHVQNALSETAFLEAAALGYAMPLDHVIRDAKRALKKEEPPLAIAQTPNRASGLPVFTARQREVAPLIAAGATDEQIGEALFISKRTASGHVSEMCEKVGVANRAALVAFLNREQPA